MVPAGLSLEELFWRRLQVCKVLRPSLLRNSAFLTSSRPLPLCDCLFPMHLKLLHSPNQLAPYLRLSTAPWDLAMPNALLQISLRQTLQ